jgi:DNA-binding XRE family transcriptional regulator
MINSDNKFRKLRRDMNLSQADLAKILGVSVSTIQRVETGEVPRLYELAIERLHMIRATRIGTYQGVDS